MEVTVLETGGLPEGAVISFHTGSLRRHAPVEKGRSVHLSGALAAEPLRVDLMSQVGSHAFSTVPGQDVYEVPLRAAENGAGEVRLKLQIRAAAHRTAEGEDQAGASGAGALPGAGVEEYPGSPSRKLQTALAMRSYLDNHDVLRQMQDLLQDLVAQRPEDPVEYMISRLEEVVRNDGRHDTVEGLVVLQDDPASHSSQSSTAVPAEKAEKADDEEEEEEEDDDGGDPLPLPAAPGGPRKQRASVSEEAYGRFNQRKAYERKVIPKDDKQKARLLEVLQLCWMFKAHTRENLDTIVDAMEEKLVEPGVRLINQGDSGDVMWVIEQGELECLKVIDGEERVVKTCGRGDLFGELALLYSVPRAASVVSRDRCVLWELDRETFKAICYEAAQSHQPHYEGFSAPSSSAAAPAAPAEAPAAAKATEAEPAGAASEAGSNAGSSDDEAHMSKQPTGARRREGVSAEAMASKGDSWTPPVYPKTAEERQQLSDIIRTSRDGKLHMLFGIVSKDTFEKIVDAMFVKAIALGEHVIEQGDVGDYFYIVKSGEFDIWVQKGEDPPKKVFQAGVGFAFGELALLYNAPRSATITAAVASEVWCLDRTAFRNLVVRSSEAQFRQYVEFLNGVDVFHVLNQDERASLAEVLEEEEFEDDEAIVEQGEKDDKMFILRSGRAVACIRGDQGEVEVMQYSSGDYFGEIALLSGEPRKASVYALGPCTCLYITRATFLRVLGPLQSLLERNIGRYEKYQDAIASASLLDAEDTSAAVEATPHNKDPKGEELFDGGALGSSKPKVVNRKRERPPDKSMENVTAHKVGDSELAASEAEPAETLADKVARDFRNPALVTPSDAFIVPDSHMMMFGGVVPGQKFTHDKHLHVRTSAAQRQTEEEDIYSWQAPSKLKMPTEIGVICQKGQKSPSDPTPNQDNFFVHHIGATTLYGVCDGHGPFGHLVSFRLVQTLPHFIKQSPHFGKDWEATLKQAFLDAHRDLVTFCGEQDINIEASGAAGSVLVLEEQTVHIAFIGDARVMLGSWNRRDSRMIFCTQDHKPNLPEEKARLEANGSEVREIDPGSHRIYLPGSTFPGLTMSRAFGDTACGGVLREPEYHKFLMQPTDQWYAIIASDGVWEFLEGEEVSGMTAKKLRLKGPRETLHFLVNASRKRWAHCCGDYCDDITAILVQWNCADAAKDTNCNHSLTVKRSV